MQLSSSLKALATTVPPEKIFYLQLSDGSRKISPEALKKSAEEQGISPLYAWSNAWRPLPYMDEVCPRDGDDQSWGGYLPVLDVCDAVLRTGWRGPWSYEVSDRSLVRRRRLCDVDSQYSGRCFMQKIWPGTTPVFRLDGRRRRYRATGCW